MTTFTLETKSRTAMAKAALNKKKTPFTSKMGLNWRKKPVKCYIWSIALCGAETWTLRKEDQNHLEISEMWWWRRTEIIWTDRVKNEKALHWLKAERKILHRVKRGRLSGLVTSCVGAALLKHLVEWKKKEGWKWWENKEEDLRR